QKLWGGTRVQKIPVVHITKYGFDGGKGNFRESFSIKAKCSSQNFSHVHTDQMSLLPLPGTVLSQ
ncbi:hypothetical protein ACQP3J_32555, partial [Escherichia coli]